MPFNGWRDGYIFVGDFNGIVEVLDIVMGFWSFMGASSFKLNVFGGCRGCCRSEFL